MKNHPLFTLDCDLSDPEQRLLAETDIGFLHVYRMFQGKPVIAGPQFTAEELGNLDAFKSVFGGGDYELRGRPPDNTGICRRVRLSIDPRECPPKSLNLEQPGLGSSAASVALPGGLSPELVAVIRAMQPPPAPPSGGLDAGVLIAMINGQSATNLSVMQMISESGNRQMQIMGEMFKSMRETQPQGTTGPDAPIKVLTTAMQIIQQLKPAPGEESKPFSWETLNTIVTKVAETVQQGKEALSILNSAAEDVPPSPAPNVAPAGGIGHTAQQPLQ